MGDLVAWSVYDDAGAPKTNCVPTFTDFAIGRAGSPAGTIGTVIADPTIVNLGGGKYGFVATASHREAGIAFLVDNGAGANPRRVSGSVHLVDQPFEAIHFEDAAGALYAGGGSPGVSSYTDPAGAARPSTPNWLAVHSPYLWSLTPSGDDLLVDVAFEGTAPASSYPERFAGEFHGYEQPAAPVPTSAATASSVIDPASDYADQLELLNPHGGVTLRRNKSGGAAANLFTGLVRAVRADVAELAVFCLNATGQKPEPYLGQAEDFHRYQVEVTVRSAAGKYDDGERLARAVHFRSQRMPPAGYVTALQQQAGPEYLGEDDNRMHQWRFFVELWWRG